MSKVKSRVRLSAVLSNSRLTGSRFLGGALVLTALACLPAGWAQTDNESTSAPAEVAVPADSSMVPTLDPLVTIYTRTPLPLEAISPSVSYISRKTMEDRQWETLNQVLLEQPGVYVSQSGQFGALTSIFTRGTDSTMTAILVDGRRLNPGFSGQYNVAQITTDNLGAIEFMRGASSTLYGSNTIGGVIDLSTVDPLALTRPHASVSGEYGSYDFYRASFEVAGHTGLVATDEPILPGLGISVGGSYVETKNNRPNNRYSQYYLLPRVDYRYSDTLRFDVLTQVYDARQGTPGDLPGPQLNQLSDYQTDSGWLVSPRVIFTPNDRLTVTAFYAYTNTRLEGFTTINFPPFPPFLTYTRFDTNNQEVNLQVDYIAWEDRLTVSAGYSYNDTTYLRRNLFTGATTFGQYWTTHSPWGQVQWTPVDDLRLIAGVRYNSFNRFQDATTFDVMGSYRIQATATTLFAKVATSYTTPTASDLSFGTVNNQQLKPEKSFSWEVGFRQPLLDNDRLGIQAVFFSNKLNDLVDFDPITFQTFNVSKATTEGVELGIHYRPDPRIKLYGNFTCLNARSRSNQPFGGPQDGQKLLRRPDYTFTLGVEAYPWESVVVGTSVTGVIGRDDFGPVAMKDYYYGRLYASWRFWEHGEIFGRIENLYDERYESAAVGFPALPMNAYVGLKFSL
jgi:vitamin B12 transporter